MKKTKGVSKTWFLNTDELNMALRTRKDFRGFREAGPEPGPGSGSPGFSKF